jgi:predicted DNA-binding transcriptional regulator AlpA
VSNKRPPATQLSFAKKAAALKAASAKNAGIPTAVAEANARHRAKVALLGEQLGYEQHDCDVHSARSPPSERLLSKAEVLRITGVTFPTIWAWMRQGRFPRARIVGGKSMWLASEIDGWLAALPIRPLKGDAGSAITDASA